MHPPVSVHRCVSPKLKSESYQPGIAWDWSYSDSVSISMLTHVHRRAALMKITVLAAATMAYSLLCHCSPLLGRLSPSYSVENMHLDTINCLFKDSVDRRLGIAFSIFRPMTQNCVDLRRCGPLNGSYYHTPCSDTTYGRRSQSTVTV